MSASTHPGFFEVLACRRAYTTLLYLLLSLATGTLAFTYAVTGISLSLGLAILILGVPVALAFLIGTRLLAVAEFHLLHVLVGEGAHPSPAPLAAGEGWAARLKALVTDGRTWTSLLYLLLLLPLGLGYFTLLVTLLALGLGLVAAPLTLLLPGHGTLALHLVAPPWILIHPALVALLCGLAGCILIPAALHLGLLLGRFQLWLGRHLLVRSRGENA